MSLASSAIFCDGCTARHKNLAGWPWEARDARLRVSAFLRAVQDARRDAQERKAPERCFFAHVGGSRAQKRKVLTPGEMAHARGMGSFIAATSHSLFTSDRKVRGLRAAASPRETPHSPRGAPTSFALIKIG